MIERGTNTPIQRPFMKNSYLIGASENGTKISVNCKNTDIAATKKLFEDTLSNSVIMVETSFIPYKLFSWGYHKAAFVAHKLLNRRES